MRVPHRLASVAVVAFLLLAAVYGATARSGGIQGRAQAGCGGQGCHFGGQDMAVTPVLGLPGNWTADRTYVLNVSIDGARDPLPNGQNAGGFSLQVSHGELSVPNGSGRVQVEEAGTPRNATHTSSGNDRRSWEVAWTAPGANATDTVTFWLAVNAVNGDGFANAFDQWNTASFDLPAGEVPPEPEPNGSVEPLPEDSEQVPALGPVFVVSALLAGIFLARTRQ